MFTLSYFILLLQIFLFFPNFIQYSYFRITISFIQSYRIETYKSQIALILSKNWKYFLIHCIRISSTNFLFCISNSEKKKWNKTLWDWEIVTINDTQIHTYEKKNKTENRKRVHSKKMKINRNSCNNRKYLNYTGKITETSEGCIVEKIKNETIIIKLKIQWYMKDEQRTNEWADWINCIEKRRNMKQTLETAFKSISRNLCNLFDLMRSLVKRFSKKNIS